MTNLRVERIKQAQDEEVWIACLKRYLVGAIHELSPEDIKSIKAVGSDYEVDLDELLFYCPPAKRTTEERDGLMRLVVPETLQHDVLHHYHSSLEGGRTPRDRANVSADPRSIPLTRTLFTGYVIAKASASRTGKQSQSPMRNASSEDSEPARLSGTIVNPDLWLTSLDRSISS